LADAHLDMNGGIAIVFHVKLKAVLLANNGEDAVVVFHSVHHLHRDAKEDIIGQTVNARKSLARQDLFVDDFWKILLVLYFYIIDDYL